MIQTSHTACELPHTPRVGVVIVTWNKCGYVLELLDDLRGNPYPNWHVHVIDNDSNDDTVEALAEQHPWVTVVRTPKNLGGSGGFCTGLCTVLQEGGFDYIWLLDNDVQVEPGALETLIEVLEGRPDAAVAGSHMIQLDHPSYTNEIGGDVDLKRGQLLLQHHRTREWFHRDEVFEVDYVAACSLLVRYSAIEEVGIWDDFFIHYDDVDWCLRMRAAGYKVLACAASRIRHMSATVKRVTWILYYDLRNILYLKNKYGSYSIWHYGRFMLLLLKYALRDELSGKGYYCELSRLALLDFLTGRMGRRESMPTLETSPTADVLSRVIAEHPGRIYVLEPGSRRFFTDAQLAEARASSTEVVGICNEFEAEYKALPAELRRIRLPSRRLPMLRKLLGMILSGPKADYLVLDIDRPCGLLGLCARKIILLVDDNCIEVDGGWRRLALLPRLVPGWLRIAVAFVGFAVSRHRLRGCADTTPNEFRTELAALGGVWTSDVEQGVAKPGLTVASNSGSGRS